jgi:hypothetical protein
MIGKAGLFTGDKTDSNIPIPMLVEKESMKRRSISYPAPKALNQDFQMGKESIH